FLPHEQIDDLVVVAGRAAQPDDVPGVLDVRLLAAEQHGAVDRSAACISARPIGGFGKPRMPPPPRGIRAPPRQTPFSRDAGAPPPHKCPLNTPGPPPPPPPAPSPHHP